MKTSSKFVLFILLCALIVVFAVYLGGGCSNIGASSSDIDSGTSSGTQTPPPQGDSSTDVTPPQSGGDDPDPDPNGGQTGSGEQDIPDPPTVPDTDAPLPIPEGGTVSVGGDGAPTYSVTVEQNDGYTLLRGDDGAVRIIPAASESNGTFIELRFIPGTSPDVLAPSFVDSYIDYTGLEDAGESQVGTTDLLGDLMIAVNDTEKVEAYLIEHSDGVLAVVISTISDESSLADGLYAILNTLSIVD